MKEKYFLHERYVNSYMGAYMLSYGKINKKMSCGENFARHFCYACFNFLMAFVVNVSIVFLSVDCHVSVLKELLVPQPL